MSRPSGKFVLRIPPTLHIRLRRESQRRGVSLNELCTAALESYPGEDGRRYRADKRAHSAVVEIALQTVGDALVGLVLFGSCARGEQMDSSDVDFLIVVSPSVELNRDLYRRWDDACSDKKISPHLVHLPDRPKSAGSIWFEAAVEGIVLYERDQVVTRFLQETRRAIAEGRVERRYSHGHPYWVKHLEAIVQNDSLAADYIKRAGNRMKAVKVLFDLESWADVVRECQEIVEICLKALLRLHRIEVPRINDVSTMLEQHRDRFPDAVAKRLDELSTISRNLRRDRELAFYGSEDLTPSEFYRRTDAETAIAQATVVLGVVSGTAPAP